MALAPYESPTFLDEKDVYLIGLSLPQILILVGIALFWFLVCKIMPWSLWVQLIGTGVGTLVSGIMVFGRLSGMMIPLFLGLLVLRLFVKPMYEESEEGVVLGNARWLAGQQRRVEVRAAPGVVGGTVMGDGRPPMVRAKDVLALVEEERARRGLLGRARNVFSRSRRVYSSEDGQRQRHETQAQMNQRMVEGAVSFEREGAQRGQGGFSSMMSRRNGWLLFLALGVAASWAFWPAAAWAQGGSEELFATSACRLDPNSEDCICAGPRELSQYPNENAVPSGLPNAYQGLARNEELGGWVVEPTHPEYGRGPGTSFWPNADYPTSFEPDDDYRRRCSYSYLTENLRRSWQMTVSIGAVAVVGILTWGGIVYMAVSASGRDLAQVKLAMLVAVGGLALLAGAYVVWEAVDVVFLGDVESWSGRRRDFMIGF